MKNLKFKYLRNHPFWSVDSIYEALRIQDSIQTLVHSKRKNLNYPKSKAQQDSEDNSKNSRNNDNRTYCIHKIFIYDMNIIIR